MNFADKFIYSSNPLVTRIRNIKFLRNLYLRYFKKFDGKIIIYPTLVCNLNCPYCVNKFHGSIHKFDTLPGEEWVKIINKEQRDVILTGGEPTLHKDFLKIINGINPGINIKLYTNFNWPDEFLKKYIKEIKKPMTFYASYHTSSGNPEKFFHVFDKLRASGKFKGSVHTVCPELGEARRLKRLFAKKGIKLAIDDDQYHMFDGCSKKFKKKVNCAKKVFLIAPDGTRFRCVSYMLRNKQPLEDLKVSRLSNPLFSDTCYEYGYCSPCDLLGEINITELKK